MNCDFVKAKIYEWVYADVRQLDEKEIQHITNCPECKAYYQDCHRAKKITALISQKEPVLANPQKLTNDILDTLDELEPEMQSVRFRIFNTAKRILAAASVCLIIVFGYEQYIIIDKMIKLEEQMSAVTATPINSSHYKEILRYYPSHSIEAVKSKLASRLKMSQDNGLKSTFILASLSVLSNDEVKNLLREHFARVKYSNEDSSMINTIGKEGQDE